jgi:small subunit ribosomal protein S4e
MGRKGATKHLKRLPAPAFWPIHRKEFRWAARPNPGAHELDRCFPLLLVVRDILHLAKTRKEARFLLSEGNVVVNGRIRRDDTYPVGLMDVIAFPVVNTAYRVLPAPRKGLILHPIPADEREFKLCQIVNKTCVKGGYLQLNLNDGRNILLPVADPGNPVEDRYETHGALKLQLPSAEITDYVALTKGVLAVITGGKNIGHWGEVVALDEVEGTHSPTITLKGDEDDLYTTIIDYVFPIGKGMPWVSLPEDDAS